MLSKATWNQRVVNVIFVGQVKQSLPKSWKPAKLENQPLAKDHDNFMSVTQ